MGAEDHRWLSTPGIAHRSVQQMVYMEDKRRLSKAVILCFNDTERDQRIKKNHDRHMKNLRDRYLEMRQRVSVKKEREKEDTVNLTGEAPSFGTKSYPVHKKKDRGILPKHDLSTTLASGEWPKKIHEFCR
ncbi:hypothetical protein PENTCL1PPCAC_18385 [Pristionchus entomophagus]|uniref:Uncharacterized protein n=1 Tax=Pristionchus entomophagus TaxID=358040 RepID=A0AAV5TPM6_9BILA|nr:hypothetical protein PENTCL1PPCAC_18385 [Pristionchus entomophagus]